MTNIEKEIQAERQDEVNGFKRPFVDGEARILKIPSTINDPEQKSILALVAYVGLNTGASEENIQAFLNSRFSISDYRNLPRHSYEEAVRFLVDLCLEEPSDMKGAAND